MVKELQLRVNLVEERKDNILQLKAAKKLGISEQLLLKTMQDAGGPNADLSVVAKKLNVTQDELKSALPKKPTR